MSQNSLQNRTLYIPQMAYGAAQAIAAAFRSVGIDAKATPDSDEQTLKLASLYLTGDECYPQKVTLGDFLKVVHQPNFQPEKTAFFMPTASGPCRFGQYAFLIKKIMQNIGCGEVMVVSPTSADGYGGIAENASELTRTAWRAVVASDILQKLLLRVRPYEITKGDAEKAYEVSLQTLCRAIEKRAPQKEQLEAILEALYKGRGLFRKVSVKSDPDILLIGAVGEIYCRLNSFSNEDLIKKIESFGAEVWLSDISEWVWYTDFERQRKLSEAKKRFSKAMIAAKIKSHIQKSDEHKLIKPFKKDIKGREEPKVKMTLDLSKPYLPAYGAMGEMTLNVGKSIYLYEQGVDGVVDISPFTCMNGIVSEAIYPNISKECNRMPIKIFYFDGTRYDIEREISIFIELARSYRKRKETGKGI